MGSRSIVSGAFLAATVLAGCSSGGDTGSGTSADTGAFEETGGSDSSRSDAGDPDGAKVDSGRVTDTTPATDGVTATDTAPETDATTTPTALPIGDLTGWKQTLAEDFSKDAAAGSGFAATYAGSWCGYVDNAKYKQANISSSGGNMVVALDGKTGAAGVFAPSGCATAYTGTTYGRYSMRFKAIAAAQNGTATMIWPVSDVWGDGEMDYPEGNFDGNIFVNHHGVGCTACGAADSTDTGVGFTDWHISTAEWTPGKVVYLLDGKIVKTVTHDIATTPHRFTMQVAPVSSTAKTGQFLIDWVAVYQRM